MHKAGYNCDDHLINMGCCLSYKSSTINDPDVEFYTEATHFVSALKSARGNIVRWTGRTSVLLYIKNGRLYHIPKCGSNLLFCMSRGYSRKLSDLGHVEVISGKVRVERPYEIIYVHNVKLGLKIEVKDCFKFNPNVIEVYRTPDAVRLAT